MIYAFSQSSLRFYWSMDRYWVMLRVNVTSYNFMEHSKFMIYIAKIKVKLGKYIFAK